MSRASHSSLRKLSQALLELNTALALPEFPDASLRAARALIGADVYTFDAFDMRKMHGVFVTWPSEVPDADVEVLNAHLCEHPSLCAIRDPRSRPVVRWSDFTTLRQFRQTGLYHDFFRLSGTRHQMALAFAADAHTSICFVYNRRQRDFTEEDRAVLHLLSPHLEQAYRKALAVSDLQRALAWREHVSRLEAVMLVGSEGRILFSTESAARLCRDYFGDFGCLAPLELREHWERRGSNAHFLKTKDEKQLVIHWTGPVRVPAPGDSPQYTTTLSGYVVRLAERQREPSLDAGLRRGLTQREAEVLVWIAKGKRNDEIATILGAKTRTVEKHVEHIMSKFRVETRGAAAAMLTEDCI